MNAFSKLAITASIALASVTFFGCSSGEAEEVEGGNSSDSTNGAYSSSTETNLSSSGGGSSSSQEGAGSSSSGNGTTTGTNGSIIVTETYRRATEAEILNYYNHENGQEPEQPFLPPEPESPYQKSSLRSQLSSYEGINIDLENNIYLIGEYEDDECRENGTLGVKMVTDIESIGYSIDNKVLGLTWYYAAEPIKFNGSSNNLEGTWTRTKSNQAISCRRYTDDYDDWIECAHGYDITKAVFTPTTVTFTIDVCPTDEMIMNGEVYKGWTAKVIDCNNIEYSKGNEKVKINYTKINIRGFYGLYGWGDSHKDVNTTVTYNNKTCTRTEILSTAQKQQACKNAADEAGTKGEIEEYYWDFSKGHERNNFKKCIIDNNFPKELFGYDDDDDDYEKVLKKSLKSKK